MFNFTSYRTFSEEKLVEIKKFCECGDCKVQSKLDLKLWFRTCDLTPVDEFVAFMRGYQDLAGLRWSFCKQMQYEFHFGGTAMEWSPKVLESFNTTIDALLYYQRVTKFHYGAENAQESFMRIMAYCTFYRPGYRWKTNKEALFAASFLSLFEREFLNIMYDLEVPTGFASALLSGNIVDYQDFADYFVTYHWVNNRSNDEFTKLCNVFLEGILSVSTPACREMILSTHNSSPEDLALTLRDSFALDQLSYYVALMVHVDRFQLSLDFDPYMDDQLRRLKAFAAKHDSPIDSFMDTFSGLGDFLFGSIPYSSSNCNVGEHNSIDDSDDSIELDFGFDLHATPDDVLSWVPPETKPVLSTSQQGWFLDDSAEVRCGTSFDFDFSFERSVCVRQEEVNNPYEDPLPSRSDVAALGAFLQSDGKVTLVSDSFPDKAIRVVRPSDLTVVIEDDYNTHILQLMMSLIPVRTRFVVISTNRLVYDPSTIHHVDSFSSIDDYVKDCASSYHVYMRFSNRYRDYVSSLNVFPFSCGEMWLVERASPGEGRPYDFTMGFPYSLTGFAYFMAPSNNGLNQFVTLGGRLSEPSWHFKRYSRLTLHKTLLYVTHLLGRDVSGYYNSPHYMEDLARFCHLHASLLGYNPFDTGIVNSGGCFACLRIKPDKLKRFFCSECKSEVAYGNNPPGRGSDTVQQVFLFSVPGELLGFDLLY